MALPEYLADVARELRAKSSAIRRDFASHRLSAGENREDLVEEFLIQHLPKRFGVSTGMLISYEGKFSNQADLVVVDRLNNAPLYGSSRNKLWPIEAAYALIEVKTGFSPTDARDAVAKGRRFKRLQRHFCQSPVRQQTTDSLYIIWAFDCPSVEAAKASLVEAVAGVPRPEQPDLVVVPDRLVAKLGGYLEVARIGAAGSSYRKQLESHHGSNLESLMPDVAEVDDLGENSLLAWYVWFDSWLRQAGGRATDPLAYLPPDATFGRRV